MKWVASNGNHIPVATTPSGDWRRCTDERKPEAERRHWHFERPYWSCMFPGAHLVWPKSPAGAHPTCPQADLWDATPLAVGAQGGRELFWGPEAGLYREARAIGDAAA